MCCLIDDDILVFSLNMYVESYNKKLSTLSTSQDILGEPGHVIRCPGASMELCQNTFGTPGHSSNLYILFCVFRLCSKSGHTKILSEGLNPGLVLLY